MSQQEMEKVIERAMSEAAFREKLIDNPKAACQEYDLSAEEVSKIVESCNETFAGEVESRISKRKFAGFMGPMGIDDIIE